MTNVRFLRPFYSSQNPLNLILTLKHLLLVLILQILSKAFIYIWKYLLITYLKAWKTPKVLCSRRHDNYVWKEVSDTWIAATVHLSHCIQCIGHFYKQHHWQRLDHIYQMAYLGVYSWFWWPNCITPHLFYILHYCNLNILCHKVLVHHQQWGLLN